MWNEGILILYKPFCVPWIVWLTLVFYIFTFYSSNKALTRWNKHKAMLMLLKFCLRLTCVLAHCCVCSEWYHIYLPWSLRTTMQSRRNPFTSLNNKMNTHLIFALPEQRCQVKWRLWELPHFSYFSTLSCLLSVFCIHHPPHWPCHVVLLFRKHHRRPQWQPENCHWDR